MCFIFRRVDSFHGKLPSPADLDHTPRERILAGGDQSEQPAGGRGPGRAGLRTSGGQQSLHRDVTGVPLLAPAQSARAGTLQLLACSSV